MMNILSTLEMERNFLNPRKPPDKTLVMDHVPFPEAVEQDKDVHPQHCPRRSSQCNKTREKEMIGNMDWIRKNKTLPGHRKHDCLCRKFIRIDPPPQTLRTNVSFNRLQDIRST